MIGALPDGRYAVVTRWVLGGPQRDAGVALGLAVELAGAGLTHGDFCPWNLLGDRPTLIDWEATSDHLFPMHDLAHFVIRSAAYLGGASGDRVLADLVAPHGVGFRYAVALGIPLAELPRLVVGYLERTEGLPFVPAEAKLRRLLQVRLGRSM